MQAREKAVTQTGNMPDICGNEEKIFEALKGRKKELYASVSNVDFERVQSAFAVALHMHQPTIPAGGQDLSAARLISNLEHMFEHRDIGDNHNAPVFFWCYRRISDLIQELAGQGHNPRIMLDYSGNLLWALSYMEGGKAVDKLKQVTCDKKYHHNVEWLGTMWSHAVVTSTPVPDIKLQIMSWRQHFASIFGVAEMARVKGFSPPEMHLPIHPDVCYEYVKALKECGYTWLLAQEHTIENLDGTAIKRPHFPHRLSAKNCLGQVEEITVLVKTQGSDTKLVGQMQPYYEAKTRSREAHAGKNVPPCVTQIGDGENGGVMMNEFPAAYKTAFSSIGLSGTVGMNGSEYLEFLLRSGIKEKDLTPVQPISQHRIWNEVGDYRAGACDAAIARVHEKDPNFNLDKGSWTNDRNWVKGYENVLSPVNQLSVAFHKKFDGKKPDKRGRHYKEALLYLLLSQSSDFRYWGQGAWTDYAREICRRGMAALA